MQKILQQKYDNLSHWLFQKKSLAIAFSGGVDSSLLLTIAAKALEPSRIVALTCVSKAIPQAEINQAAVLAIQLKISHKLVTVDTIKTINEHDNSPLRCYYCKKMIFNAFIKQAKESGFATVIEGSHQEDETDYRPGLKALKELSVASPLKICKFNKQEIRVLAEQLGLPHYNKPSSACLVSRFPFGVEITQKALKRVEYAEKFLHTLGFYLCRVRDYGSRARIEIDKAALPRASTLKEVIQKKMLLLGYDQADIDPAGYKRGSMNTR
ncbi:MAG: ATP-dependent sacrificial sulfur transferase LarE [Spirochaetales bacterium]|nr:ATP-dependent sacrificial sulfur transferase LarE [Spirochaetales bacterium]